MTIIISISVLLLTAIIIQVIRYWQPQFRYSWLIAVFASLLSWAGLLISRTQIPTRFQLISWRPIELFPVSPTIIIDEISWSYGLALSGLLLAYLLTSTVRSGKEATDNERTIKSEWLVWGGPLVIVGLGLFNLFSGDLIALILTWTALDIFELFLRLRGSSQSEDTGRMILSFSYRVASIVPVIWAVAISQSQDYPINLDTLSIQAGILIMIAAVLRLGLIPIQLPSISDFSPYNVLVRFVPVTSALMLLTRLAGIDWYSGSVVLLFAVSFFFALIGSLIWTIRKLQPDSQPYWIIALASFMIPAAALPNVSVNLSLGMATILSGGMIYFYTRKERKHYPLGILGLLGITFLPYTATWYGVWFYSGNNPVYVYAFIIPQAIIIAGFLKKLTPEKPVTGSLERIIALLYPLGLLLFPVVQYLVFFWILLPIESFGIQPPSLLESWPGILASLLGVSVYFVGSKIPELRIPTVNLNMLEGPINTTLTLPRIIFQLLGLGVGLIDRLIEGRGSLLWTILLLTLLISILTQFGT